MNDTIRATQPMASPAFSPLYSHAGYDSDEATNANQFLSTLHSRLMGILAQRVREAIKNDALYTRVKETDNKLHYSIGNGLLLAQNTNGYENLYIPEDLVRRGYPYGIASSRLEFVTGRTGPHKTGAPGPFPSPAPLNGLGRGVFFGIPCPCSRSGPRPTHTPDGSPLKMSGNKRGPVLGMSAGGRWAGVGRGLA